VVLRESGAGIVAARGATVAVVDLAADRCASIVEKITWRGH
jgi:hypothetical protein